MEMETNPEPRGDLKRRTVLAGAAWSVPLIAVAVATPAAVASTPQNVSISSSCYGINILGVGQSFPQFNITAIGATIQAGSTFILTGGALANLSLGAVGTGGFSINLLSSGVGTVTLTDSIPAGSTFSIQVTGIASAQLITTYTLAVGSIIGNSNNNHSDDSASQSLTGLSLFGLFVGVCS